MGPYKWHASFFRFLSEHGFKTLGTGRPSTHVLSDYCGVDGHVIVSGTSPRKWVLDGHAVIYFHGKLFHDPHPSRAGLVDVKSWFLIERI